MSIQIKKMHVERKRYLKTGPLKDPSEWLFELARLKDFLIKNSSFQIVGPKIYLEFSHKSEEVRLMIEVVGVPVPLEYNALVLCDQESSDVLIQKIEGKDLFSLDFLELLATCRSLYERLDRTLRREGKAVEASGLSAFSHIVYDREKIELHFFSQKDYIQKQF